MNLLLEFSRKAISVLINELWQPFHHFWLTVFLKPQSSHLPFGYEFYHVLCKLRLFPKASFFPFSSMIFRGIEVQICGPIECYIFIWYILQNTMSVPHSFIVQWLQRVTQVAYTSRVVFLHSRVYPRDQSQILVGYLECINAAPITDLRAYVRHCTDLHE